MTRYSPTKLSVYRRCPRQFQFQYVHKIPRAPTQVMTLGATLHRVLERPGETAEATAQRLQQEWTPLGERDAQWRQEAEQIVANFHAAKDEGIPILQEKRLSAPYDGVTLWGIVDRVDLLPSGGLEIIDYKSTRHIVDAPRDLPDETWLQLTIYHHLVAEHLPMPVERWAIHYLRTHQRLCFLPDEAIIRQGLQGAASMARAIEQESDYAPQVGDHCSWCPYLRRCPEGRQSVARP